LFADINNVPPGEPVVRDYVWGEADGILYIRRTVPTNDLAWHPVLVPPNDSMINFQVLARCRQSEGDLRATHSRKAHPVFRRGSRPPVTDPIANMTWWYATAPKIGLEVEDAGVELEIKVITKQGISRNFGPRRAFGLLTANFYGVAKICDRTLFERALAFGVGDAKAFGLGFIFFWQRGQYG
jgi:hypothetical protein